MQVFSRILIGMLAGASLCWAATAFILSALFANGGYTREALIELPSWAFAVIGLSGAVFGAPIAAIVGSASLPRRTGQFARGSLYGVAAIVTLTLIVASIRGGATSKGQAPYLLYGLFYGVPAGLVLGRLVNIGIDNRRKHGQE